MTYDDHLEALSLVRRGRREKTPPVFISTFAESSDAYVIPPTGGWFHTAQAPGREPPAAS